MFRNFDLIQKIFLGIFALAFVAMGYFYIVGYDSSISWGIVAKANSESLLIHSFQKGPFLLDFKGMIYKLTEVFSAGPIERFFTADALFLGILFFGIATIIAVTSTLSRGWFIGLSVLIVMFFFFLRLDDIGAFGFSSASRYATATLFFAYLIPAYIFQAFWKVELIHRILILNLISVILLLFIGIPTETLIDHIISNSYFSFQIITLLFLVLIAEENIFGILFLVTRVKGGKNSEKHFMIFGFAYLLIVGLYYADMAGWISRDVRFFDPFILFMISAIVASWSIWFKEGYFRKVIDLTSARILFFALGLIALTFLAHNMFRGNDPAYQGFLYFIIYAHLAFGAFFFFYIILNFVNPLSSGLQVYKIVYHAQNFPYISARLAGLAAIAAFFFLADKEAYFLMISGQYNYQGVEAITNGDENLGVRYFDEARVYGHDNHFSNYQLGMYYDDREEFQVANFRFQRATYRYPSPQAYINQSMTAELMEETTEAMVALQSGLLDFPGNGYLQNNLGLLFNQIGSLDSARKYLGDEASTGSWNEAGSVNYLVVRNDVDSTTLASIYRTNNLAVKSNALASAIKNNIDVPLPLDSVLFNKSQLPLHKGTYLVNYSWANANPDENEFLLNAMNVPMNEELFRSAKQAIAIRSYLVGNINHAFLLLDDMIFQGSNLWKGIFHNQKGKMALEQQILSVARKSFEEALSYGNEEARINLIATLLELEEIDEAYRYLDQFASIDSFYVNLKADIERLVSGQNLSEEMTKSYVYYNYDQLGKEVVSKILASAEKLYIEGLWMKIYKEQLLDNPDMADGYISLFEPYLKGKTWDLQLATLDFIQGNSTDSTTFYQLKDLANQNAFNEPLILEVVKRISSEHNMDAYDLLIRAIGFNPDSPVLLKAYIEESVKQRLFDYAESNLDRLQPHISTQEYLEFSSKIRDRIAELREESFGSFQ
ncbi:MAG: tetratricopeptide repeat protein [Bacteroidota bacterium]